MATKTTFENCTVYLRNPFVPGWQRYPKCSGAVVTMPNGANGETTVGLHFKSGRQKKYRTGDCGTWFIVAQTPEGPEPTSGYVPTADPLTHEARHGFTSDDWHDEMVGIINAAGVPIVSIGEENDVLGRTRKEV